MRPALVIPHLVLLPPLLQVLGGGVAPRERPEPGHVSAGATESVGSPGGARRDEVTPAGCCDAVCVFMTIITVPFSPPSYRCLAGGRPPGETGGRAYEYRCN